MPNIGVCEMLQLIFLYKNVHNTHTHVAEMGKMNIVLFGRLECTFSIESILCCSHIFFRFAQKQKNEETFLAYRFYCNIPLDNMLFCVFFS